jgi:hypothetical protein
MVKMMLLAEFPDAHTEEEAMQRLDAFCEKSLPTRRWNMTLSRVRWSDLAPFVLATSPLHTERFVKAMELD